MKGLCVEVIAKASPFCGKRGVVASRLNSTILVNIDDAMIRFKNIDLLAVFTLGLPRESRTVVKATALTPEVIHRVLSTADTTKFIMVYLGSADGEQHFAKVRGVFLERAVKEAMQKDKEPLLRVYIANYSQNDPGARIVFADSMGPLASHPAVSDMDADTLVQAAVLSEAGGTDMGEFNLKTLMQHIPQTAPSPMRVD